MSNCRRNRQVRGAARTWKRYQTEFPALEKHYIQRRRKMIADFQKFMKKHNFWRILSTNNNISGCKLKKLKNEWRKKGKFKTFTIRGKNLRLFFKLKVRKMTNLPQNARVEWFDRRIFLRTAIAMVNPARFGARIFGRQESRWNKGNEPPQRR